MPELPDIEIFKNYVDSTSLHQEIDEITVNDEKIMEISTEKVRKKLKNTTLESTERKGKYLFCKTGKNEWLVFHFGMTGKLNYAKNIEPPKHAHFQLHFKNGYTLYFINTRKLGRVNMTGTIADFSSEKQLGEDALSISKEDFIDFLTNRKGNLKNALTDQKNIAGIGNIYADEILFQAKWHPKACPANLSEKDLDNLYQIMHEVLQTAIDNHAEPNEFPAHFIIPHRKKKGICPECQSNIERITVSGRGTYFCPECQHSFSD